MMLRSVSRSPRCCSCRSSSRRSGAAAALARAARGRGAPGLVLGPINAALPFTLIAWGEKHVDSGVAAIANATVPLFVVLLAIRFRPERAGHAASGWSGSCSGSSASRVLAGVQPGRRLVGGRRGRSRSCSRRCRTRRRACTAQQRVGDDGRARARRGVDARRRARAAARSRSSRRPQRLPGWQAIASIARARRSLGTALAQLVLFRMLRLLRLGRARALVTYLMPPVRALLRRRPARRAGDRRDGRRARADPRRRRARLGRAALHDGAAGQRVTIRPPRAARRRRLPRSRSSRTRRWSRSSRPCARSRPREPARRDRALRGASPRSSAAS